MLNYKTDEQIEQNESTLLSYSSEQQTLVWDMLQQV